MICTNVKSNITLPKKKLDLQKTLANGPAAPLLKAFHFIMPNSECFMHLRTADPVPPLNILELPICSSSFSPSCELIHDWPEHTESRGLGVFLNCRLHQKKGISEINFPSILG